MDVLMKIPLEQLEKITNSKIARVIVDIREGKLKVSPGYDGEYGKLLLDGKEEEKKELPPPKDIEKQKSLGEF